jgi:hypothetical protein
MSFELSWLFDKRVVYIDISGDIEIGDIESIGHAFNSFYMQGVHPVYIVLDVQRVQRAPISLEQIKKLEAGDFYKATTFVLANNSTARLVASLVVKVISTEFRFVENRKSVLASLYQIEPELRQIELKVS